MAKAGRRAEQIQAAPPPAAAPAPAADAPAEAPPEAAAPGRVGWGWRVVLFLWATSFLFLLVYEVLAAVLKGATRLF
jgi:hypothetical protein